MHTAVIFAQYVLALAVPVVMLVLVVMRTRPGPVRVLGVIAFVMMSLSGLVGVAQFAIGRALPLPGLQLLLTYGGVALCVVAGLWGRILAKAEEEQ